MWTDWAKLKALFKVNYVINLKPGEAYCQALALEKQGNEALTSYVGWFEHFMPHTEGKILDLILIDACFKGCVLLWFLRYCHGIDLLNLG